VRALLKAGLIILMTIALPAGFAVSSLNAPARAAMAMEWSESVSEYVLQIRKTVKTTDMEGYLAIVNNPNGVLLLDVREDAEFKVGHVPGAVNIPRGRAFSNVETSLGKSQIDEASIVSESRIVRGYGTLFCC
jgi:3-mercaptopyruvate sulfurtransferase SseA